MTVIKTQIRMIGGANRRIACADERAAWRAMACWSRKAHMDFTRQKVWASNHRYVLPLDHTVYGDPAADVIAVALRHDAGGHRGKIVDNVYDHGSGAALIWCVFASASQ